MMRLPCRLPLFYRKALSSLLLLTLLAASLAGQVNFCGTYAAQPPNGSNPDSLAYDRFGNVFDLDDLKVPPPVNGFNSPPASGGYFITTELGGPPQNIVTVVDQVLTDVSNLVQRRQGQTDCGLMPSQTVRLQVVWINFANPDPVLVQQLGLTLPLPAAGAGIGTPFYSGQQDFACQEVALDRPFIKINGGKPDGGDIFDGRLLLNSNLPATTGCPPLTWNTNPAAVNFPCQLDLYTVVLHEMLHILGYASRMGFTDAYSLWDQSLRTVTNYTPGGGGANPQDALVNASGCVRNCWQQAAGFAGVAANSCSNTSPGPDVVVGDAAIAPIGGDPNVAPGTPAFSNMLSHLSQTCRGQNVTYVMRPGLAANQFQRTVTDPERSILCELGYAVNSATVTCSGCYNIAHQDWSRDADAACCFKTYFACAGQTLTVLASELLCNDITNGTVQEITRIWRVSGGALPLANIQPNAAGTGWDISIPADIGDDRVNMSYTSRGCDCRLHNSRFTIFIDQQCPPCNFTPDSCDNTVCGGDFENYTNTEDIESRFGWPIVFEGSNQVSGSPDVKVTSTGNHYLHLGNFVNSRESVCLPLQDCVQPQCSLTLSLDLSGFSTSSRLEVWGSKARPCSATSPVVVPVANNCGAPTVCGPTATFMPRCIANITAANIYANTNAPNFAPSGNILWQNNTADEICFLTLVAAGEGNVYVDNIVATQRCDPDVTVTPNAPGEVCPGQPFDMSVQVCAGAVQTTVNPNLLLPPGWTTTGNLQPFLLNPGQCTTLNFVVQVPQGAVIGSVQNIVFNGTITGFCATEPFSGTTQVTVADCGGDPEPLICPCTEANTLNIAASANGTRYSVLEALQNFDQNNDGILDASDHHGCIAVSGRLLIDRDLSVTGCANIRMQPCSEIVVQGPLGNAPPRHLRMEFNNIYGCEQMWRSVTVQPHARLTFRHNTVADAQYANWVNPSSWLAGFSFLPTQVDIQFNNFVRNHVNLNVPGNGGGFLGGNVWQTPFIGNDMLCTGPANPLLPACPLAVPDNYEPVFGYAGATISGANFNIGVPGGSFNTFSNLRNGVVAERVFLNVDNATFTNMVGFLNFELPSLDFFRGVGVAANNSWTTVRDAGFDRAGHAMFLNGGLNTLQRNTTSQVHLGLESFEPLTLGVFDNNDFGFLDFGIRAWNLTGGNFLSAYLIDDNDFSTQDVQTDINGDWAVQLQNMASTIMPEGNARISRNRIHIDDQIAGGLFIGGQDAWGISDNRVDFTVHPQNVPLTGNGVNLQNSRYNRLYGNELNDVVGTAGATIGFAVGTSVGNIFCCNSTNRNFIGSLFFGGCNGTDYRTTTMASHGLSLFLPEGTVIGDQRSLTMTNSNLFGCDSGLAWNDNGDPFVVQQSEFFVTSLTCPRHPQSAFPATGWFVPANEGVTDVECGSDPQCAPVNYPRRERKEVEESDLSVAQRLYASTPRYAALQWEGARDLYARLKQYPTEMLGQSAGVDAFYTAAEQGSAVRSFHDAELAVSAVREVPAAWGQVLKTAADSVTAVEQRAKAPLTSLTAASTRADSLSVYWQSEAVRSGIVPHMAVILEKQHQLDSLRRARAAAALPAVLSLPASGTLQSNRKAVLRIYLEVTTAGAKQLTAAQFADVKAVAEQCVLEGGSAVYMARALYQMNEKRHFDDLALCGEGQERSTGAKRPATKGVALWPSPSTGRLQVFVPGIEAQQSVHLRVTDMSGRAVLEKTLTTSDGNLLLDGSSLTPGIYFCQVRTASEVLVPVKFVISL